MNLCILFNTTVTEKRCTWNKTQLQVCFWFGNIFTTWQKAPKAPLMICLTFSTLSVFPCFFACSTLFCSVFWQALSMRSPCIHWPFHWLTHNLPDACSPHRSPNTQCWLLILPYYYCSSSASTQLCGLCSPLFLHLTTLPPDMHVHAHSSTHTITSSTCRFPENPCLFFCWLLY